MSYHDYWHGDCTIVKFYRDKQKHELDKINFQSWLNGVYIYNALIATAPIINAFSSEHKPLDYLEKPLAITKEQQEQEQIDKQLDIQARLRAFAEQHNTKYEVKHG